MISSSLSTHSTLQQEVLLPADEAAVRRRLLGWLAQFPYAAWYDSCNSPVDRYGQYEWLAGAAPSGARRLISWDDLPQAKGTWWMGALPYELKNRLEPRIFSRQSPTISWPELAFFAPDILIERRRGQQHLRLTSRDPYLIDTAIRLIHEESPFTHPPTGTAPLFSSSFSREAYIRLIHTLQHHIREGDFYEINLAQAFETRYQLPDPAKAFLDLIEISPVPFAAFVRFGHRYALCASPERFLQLRSGQLCSQPIKGTAARGKDEEEDARNLAYLSHSEKEQAENVMIVDLSRNDLHRSCETGSVSVPHLFEVQTFPQVFQLVSTVIGHKRSDIPWHQALAHTFPPGSMTGAPKVMTLDMIDRYEPVGRGLYAGSLGYIQPSGDFDFNVVIRSLMYDAQQGQLSYHVGGAITYDSDPAQEYEETLIKARAIRTLFGQKVET